jgi:hypothetical protein
MAMRWQMVAYVVLVLTCGAGVFRFGPWSVVASASCLILVSLVANQTASVPQSRLISEPVMIAANVLNSAAIASAAYVFGHVARWAWGL